MDVRLATSTDRDAVIATVTKAFFHDPAFRAFFGDGDGFEPLVGEFARYLFDRRVDHSTAWVGHDGDVVALWDGPWAPNSVSGDHGGHTLDLPADVLARLNQYDAAVDAALPDQPHWYLGILACHPDRQGEGLGRLAAEVGLRAAQRDRLPAYLETAAPDNVRVYQSAGWTVDTELTGIAGLTVWVMRHDGLH